MRFLAMVNDKDERKRCCFDCDSDIHQTNSPKRRRLELINSSTDDAIDGKKASKLLELPLNCFQHILSFATYENVSHMRRVSERFNIIGKKLLDKGLREMKRRLKTEIELTEKRAALFPTNAESSDYTLDYLIGLNEAINNLSTTYSYYIDYFVAGKVLDKANCLLKDFNSLAGVPYLPEHRKHLLLHGPVVAHCKRAQEHFELKILGKFIDYNGNAEFERDRNLMEMLTQIERNKLRIPKINYLKIRRQKINSGNELIKGFLKLIAKLNKNVLYLTQLANKVNQAAAVPVIITKRPNLAALPSACLQRIVSHFNCDSLTQLRMVCKSFNEVCKKELNREFEDLKQKLKFQINLLENLPLREAVPSIAIEINLLKDLRSSLELCKDTNKCYLGSNNYCFAAGKALDEAKRVWDKVGNNFDDDRSSISHIKRMLYKTIVHFKFNVVPKYLPSTRKRTYVPDFIMTGAALNCEKESHLKLEDIEKLVEEADVKIEEQNNRNRNLLKIISSLKKNVAVLNKKMSDYNNYYCIEKAEIKF